MERRMRGNSHVRCGAGEKVEIISKPYLSLLSQELVQVGLDLLCTPTLIFYQFSWSLFTINQAARRAWRIGQTEECRLYYLAVRP